MSDHDQRDSGIPTRAIHEAYLSMQQAHRQYRQARDHGGDVDSAHATLQDSVLTFYELVRPHLKHESGLSDYWEGHIPDYSGWDFQSEREAVEYIRDKGTGIYQVQRHPPKVLTVNKDLQADGGLNTFSEWHEFLGLSDSERLVAVKYEASEAKVFYKVLRIATLPLRKLDSWKVTVRKNRTRGDGFMASESAVNVTREYVPVQKLVTAKRLLVESADKLGALSEFEASTSRTKITKEDIQKVEKWRQKQLK
ncbi:MAG: hypothetical protein ACOCR6_02785 [archaeon]